MTIHIIIIDINCKKMEGNLKYIKIKLIKTLYEKKLTKDISL